MCLLHNNKNAKSKVLFAYTNLIAGLNRSQAEPFNCLTASIILGTTSKASPTIP